MDALEQLRNYLNAKIQSEGFTRKAFAKRIGLTQGGLSLFLNRQRGIRFHTLQQIATAFHLTPWELLKKASEFQDD